MSNDHAASPIVERYVAENPNSLRVHEKADKLMPSGITHDIRSASPFLIYVQKANGSRKWDIDGHEYIDLVMGHGALLMGHEHPQVTDAVVEQARKGTHYGANHELEVEWASLVTKLVPSAQKVRFTGSGTEATMMAIRLCRAFSGKNKILKFQGHFHGWHDVVQVGVRPPWEVPDSPGIPKEVQNTVVVAPASDPERLDAILSADQDIACVILEPSGASYGLIPLRKGFLADVREITKKHGVLLVFDEVITGFRWAPGGAQERFGVVPDMTTLAKILAGGLPGGACAGPVEIMDLIAFRRDDPQWNRFKKMAHPGTYNANPLSAAAGTTCLKLVSNSEVQQRADAMCERLVKGFNEAIVRQGVKGCVYSESSVFHTLLGADCGAGSDSQTLLAELGAETLRKGMRPVLANKLQLAMLLNGVHVPGGAGWVSTVHTPQDIDACVAAFEKSLLMLKAEGEL